MKLKILQKDIDKGKPGNVRSCPIALALKRISFNKRILVTESRVYIENKLYFKLSNLANRFAIDFDIGRNVKPCTLELELIRLRGG
jgi:hypothetical protein